MSRLFSGLSLIAFCLALPLSPHLLAEDGIPQITPFGGEQSTPDISDWSLEKRAAYVYGYHISQQIRQQIMQAQLNPQDFMTGFMSGLQQQQPVVPPDTWQGIMEAYQAQVEEGQRTQAAANKSAGEDHLAALRGRDGVRFTESGIAYEVLTEGSGPKPSASSTVRVHYEGRLIDGTIFDSSIQRGEPVEFPLTGVIPGWTEGLQLMATGSKYRLHIPAHLAYGEQGRPSIPPNSLLIFEVELLEIK